MVFCIGLARVEEVGGDFDGDEGAAAGIADDLEGGLGAVEDFKTLLHVFHADACAPSTRRIGASLGAGITAGDSGARAVTHADAVVGYFDEHAIPSELAAQRDGAAIDAGLEAMLDAVFDERLQKDAGHEDVERLRVDFFFDVELVGAETYDFDAEVVVGEA